MKKLTKTQIRLYRKLRYRRGHGVHSPFVYNLITKVIEEKTPFYAFDEIEKIRKNLIRRKNRIAHITLKESQNKNYGALLFRLVNFFKCHTVLQIGGSTGIMSLYLSMASPNNCDCYILEERADLCEAVKEFAETHKLNKLQFIYGEYEKSTIALKNKLEHVDLIFINQLGNSDLTKKTLELFRNFIGENTILIIDGIEVNKKMKILWKELKDLPESRMSINLYALGILFFNKKLHKQHYINYFNYGKKQNLHRKRGRRIHLFGRRKKSAEIKSTD